ncbi:hypothetical protein CN933_23735 [Sinorhizobium sp. M4_45]|nr:hypothetical protein CN933_23735 [Sinorhizobium sp. M4_45]
MIIELEAVGIGIYEILHGQALTSNVSLFVLHIPRDCRKKRSRRRQKYGGQAQRRRFHDSVLSNPKTRHESMEHFL